MKSAVLFYALLHAALGVKLGSLLNLGKNRSAVALEPLALAMLGGKNTPELAAIKKQIEDSINSEMKPAIMANLRKVQALVNDAATAGNKCGNTALTEAASYKLAFTTAQSEHSKCRSEESTLVRSSTACTSEKTVLASAKTSQCDEVTDMEKKQAELSQSCATSGGESYLEQVQRLQEHFAAAVTTYKNQKALCSNTTTAAEKKETECEDMKQSHVEKKLSCNNAQATMDSSSCAYSEAYILTCGTCYKDAATSYEASKANFAAQQNSMRLEMQAILRIGCYLGSLDATDKSAALSRCAGLDHTQHADVVSITLTYPSPPAASCSALAGTAGTEEYEASVYQELPSDAPAGECTASCCKPVGQVAEHQGLLSWPIGFAKWGTVGSLGLMDTGFTGMAWMRFRRAIHWAHPIISISKSDTGSNEGFGIRAGHGLYFSIYDGECHGGNSGDVDVGTWTHLAFTYDPSNHAVIMYRDGDLAKACTKSAKLSSDLNVVLSTGRAWSDLYNVYLFKRVMTQEEIRELKGNEPVVEL